MNTTEQELQTRSDLSSAPKKATISHVQLCENYFTLINCFKGRNKFLFQYDLPENQI